VREGVRAPPRAQHVVRVLAGVEWASRKNGMQAVSVAMAQTPRRD
jgi:hypothetical protein